MGEIGTSEIVFVVGWLPGTGATGDLLQWPEWNVGAPQLVFRQ